MNDNNNDEMPVHRRFLLDVAEGRATLLAKKDCFRFKCTQCGGCCRNNTILLKPYDIYRLSRSLGMTTGDFLKKHCVRYTGKDSGLPLAILRFRDNGRGACPFLVGGRCSVHADRPSVCRLYPLGTVALGDEGPKYYLQPVQCPGYGKGRPQTVRRWLRQAKLRKYTEKNKRFFDLIGYIVRSRVLEHGILHLVSTLSELFYDPDGWVPGLARNRSVPVPDDWDGMFSLIENTARELVGGIVRAREESEGKAA